MSRGPEQEDAAASSRGAARPKLVAAAVALAVTAAVLVANSYAFLPIHAGHWLMLGILGLCYGSFTLATLAWLRSRGTLVRRLAPQRGDITIGALLAVVLYVIATLVFKTMEGPDDVHTVWITRIYLQLGDPRYTGSFAVGIAVLLIAAAEEATWRGLVMGHLAKGMGERAAWLVTTALYAAAHVPTVFLLSDPIAGPNPMLVLAAAGCGLVWGYLAMKTGRLAPGMFCHALFTWGVVEYPIWRM